FTGDQGAAVVIVDGTPKKRAEAYAAAVDARWVLVGYDLLDRDRSSLESIVSGSLLIADEAHRLKNYQAKRTIAALALARLSTRRIALTGTPQERNVEEWFQVLSGFVAPGCLGTPLEFNNRYRYKAAFGFEGARNVGELRDRSMPFYGRNVKEDVATHLPPLRVQQVLLDPDPAYAAALRRAHREAAEEIRESNVRRLAVRNGGALLLDGELVDEMNDGAELTAVGQLRLMCSSPRLVAGSTSAAAAALRAGGLVPDEDGPKLDELRTMCAERVAAQRLRQETMAERGVQEATAEMVHGERLVVFTFSRKMADLIAERLSTDGVPHVLFTGTTSGADRDAAVAAFTDPTSEVCVFVATDAAAEGLNLGRCCSTLVQFDLPWTPGRAIQRMNRIHRLDGTAPSYLVLNFVVANTMEVGMSRLLGERADLADALLGETGSRQKATGYHGRGRSLLELAMDPFTAPPARQGTTRKRPTATGNDLVPGLTDADAPSDEEPPPDHGADVEQEEGRAPAPERPPPGGGAGA
ncbi:MAG: DEAD/DEAH box helicase, partial [Pseudorhodobacter sp.]|nr:DEAD/DEAH box helicase [Frankiaceae bacterium]